MQHAGELPSAARRERSTTRTLPSAGLSVPGPLLVACDAAADGDEEMRVDAGAGDAGDEAEAEAEAEARSCKPEIGYARRHCELFATSVARPSRFGALRSTASNSSCDPSEYTSTYSSSTATSLQHVRNGEQLDLR